MPALTPLVSAQLANDVYAVTRQPNLQEAYIYLNRRYKDSFSFGKSNMLKGQTGGPGPIKVRTAFGFTLIGKGKLEGHVFILFRGTQYLADWLTNLNLTLSRSSMAQPVHDGFNIAFKSMKPKLKTFMGGLDMSKVKEIHCVGHSLGGALASLCAEWIKNSYSKTPNLYSFGSPRVGLIGFADLITKRVGAENIYRAYHKTDIVPYIPIWPFTHIPSIGDTYYLPSPGVIPGAKYHDMEEYIKSVRPHTWKGLTALKPERHTDDQIKRWLKSTGPLGMTITTIEWLNRALLWVLRKVLRGAEWVISETFATSFTLMDKLAYILAKGVKLVETVSSWVIYLIRKIMRLMGYGEIVDAADLTHSFIRTILMKFQRKLNDFARQALSQTLAKGRAI
jgi:triacylglycerol lipase